MSVDSAGLAAGPPGQESSPRRELPVLPIAAAASAWGLVLDRLEGETAATMIVLLSAVALGATGWFVGAYYEGTQTDPALVDALRSNRVVQIAVAALVLLVSLLAGALNGPVVAAITILLSPALLSLFAGDPPPADEATNRREAARAIAGKAGGLALVAMLLDGTLNTSGRDTLLSGTVLGLAAFAVGFGAALTAATFRLFIGYVLRR